MVPSELLGPTHHEISYHYSALSRTLHQPTQKSRYRRELFTSLCETEFSLPLSGEFFPPNLISHPSMEVFVLIK